MRKLRLFMMVLTLVILTACAEADSSTDDSHEGDKAGQAEKLDKRFAELENEFDVQLGVYALDIGSNQTIAYQAEERFAFASTYKVLAAAIVLKQKTMEELKEVITYTEDDLVTYSPVTEKHVDTGMTLLEIAEAAIRTSDNTAGNLLFEAIGGPDKFEEALRGSGDEVTQADRYETELNAFTPEDPRDTSTPKAMAESLQAYALGEQLSHEKRELLTDWMKGNATGDALIRAGAPEGWVVGDKSGAASYGTRNDIAVVWPPDREPIVIAIMSRHDAEDAEYDDALIAEAAEIVFGVLE
ncbi:class A beta-lactamase [Oceanobacillus kapialis]|uniref:class A beta-lactamase n=1 Tax=Oceanobacillus kapialis TaxID=481353 RepID=UPI0038512AA1